MPEEQIHLNAALLFSIIGALIGVGLTGGWWTLWRAVTRLEKKIDTIGNTCSNRLPACLNLFTKEKDFAEWKASRDPIWKAINHHYHTAEGKVVRED